VLHRDDDFDVLASHTGLDIVRRQDLRTADLISRVLANAKPVVDFMLKRMTGRLRGGQ